MKLYIKYMVSRRCKNLVMSELDDLGISYSSIDLGMVQLPEDIDPENRAKLHKSLLLSGLELMDDERSLMVENTKNLILEMIFSSDTMPEESYSDYIARKLNCNYHQLSAVFSEVNGITIQKYIINNKIERIKELLIYSDLSLIEISYKLQYSSVAHLSNQFKKCTGFSPSYFQILNLERHIKKTKLATL